MRISWPVASVIIVAGIAAGIWLGIRAWTALAGG